MTPPLLRLHLQTAIQYHADPAAALHRSIADRPLRQAASHGFRICSDSARIKSNATRKVLGIEDAVAFVQTGQ